MFNGFYFQLNDFTASSLLSSPDDVTDSQFVANESEKSIKILTRAGFAVGPTSTRPSSSTVSINSTQTFPNVAQKRNFSTTQVLDKRNLRVTEEVVVNKRQKLSSQGSANVSNGGVNLTDFSVDDAGYVVVYTDGACTMNGKKGAKAGIGVWFGDNHSLNVSDPVRGWQTNNTAEILAAETALVRAKQVGINKLNVKTDSQFVINCITKWISKWKKNGWTLSTGKPVINKLDLVKLDAAMADMDIKWSYVKAHCGLYGNEAADRLAVEGANKN